MGGFPVYPLPSRQKGPPMSPCFKFLFTAGVGFLGALAVAYLLYALGVVGPVSDRVDYSLILLAGLFLAVAAIVRHTDKTAPPVQAAFIDGYRLRAEHCQQHCRPAGNQDATVITVPPRRVGEDQPQRVPSPRHRAGGRCPAL